MDLKKLADLGRTEAEKMVEATAKAEAASRQGILDNITNPAQKLRDEFARGNFGALGLAEDAVEREQRRRQEEFDRSLAGNRLQLDAMYAQQREHREREDEKRDNLRRIAAASEAALEEERRKRQLAEAAAKDAIAEKVEAFKRAKRAERQVILGLVIGLLGAFIGAWPFIKDSFGL